MTSYPSKQIIDRYNELVAELDEVIAELCEKRFDELQCRPGCSDCCVRFSVLPLEAAIVKRVLHDVHVEGDSGKEKCLLLKNDCCTVYDNRPIICRTQGLALGYVDEDAGAIEVSACPLNFPEDYPLTHEDLLFMDEFNSRLYELNLEFCAEVGLDPEKRIPLADLLG